jgi:hypothetical protein
MFQIFLDHLFSHLPKEHFFSATVGVAEGWIHDDRVTEAEVSNAPVKGPAHPLAYSPASW